jgi:hypothetical protein
MEYFPCCAVQVNDGHPTASVVASRLSTLVDHLRGREGTCSAVAGLSPHGTRDGVVTLLHNSLVVSINGIMPQFKVLQRPLRV